MKNFAFFERLTFVFAATAIGLSLWMSGHFFGFSNGASLICEFQYPVTKPIDGGISFWFSHGDPYVYVGGLTRYIAGILLAFTVVKLIERWWIVSFLLLLPLGYAILYWFELKRIMHLEIATGASGRYEKGLEYTELLRYSEVPVWILLGILGSLFLLQLLTAIRKFRVPKSSPTSALD